MKKILLSIKPQYAHAILDGRKTVEYRKVRPREEKGVVVIYSSSPEQNVIGEFCYDGIYALTPQELWNATLERGCIRKEAYDKYYQDKTTAYALNIVSFTRYDKPKSLTDYGVHRAPQSWVYID